MKPQIMARATSIGAAVILGLWVAAGAASCRGRAVEPSVASAPKPGLMNETADPIMASFASKKSFRSPLAGSWYDADPNRLAKQIDEFLEQASGEIFPDVRALILPHAGYRWSGRTAAYGIRQIAGKRFSRIVILGPSHRYFMENVASVPDFTHAITPLGEIPIDAAFIDDLKTEPFFKTIPQAHDGEHSVQIEFPLLQRARTELRIVPIVVGRLELKTARKMGKALLKRMDRDTLVIVSSDFTHFGDSFGYRPFSENIRENLEKLDMGAVEAALNKDAEGFLKYYRKTGATVCGRDPILILLSMLPERATGRLLKYDTSGAMTGDFEHSVSYVSVAYSTDWDGLETNDPSEEASALTGKDERRLLNLARRALLQYLETGKQGNPSELEPDPSPGMSRTMGAFVTLKTDGRLRGCIGEIEPRRPLYEAVIEQAVNAGAHDPRFDPVRKEEMDGIEMEISALTSPQPAPSWRDIVVGRHGMTIEKDGRRAVFLPQVAVEQKWTLEETLTRLAVKAGLDPRAWRDPDAKFTTFEALVFKEESP